MRRLTWEQVLAWRLRRQWLIEPAPAGRLAEVAGAVCGIHAQVMATAELSLGLRVAGATRRDVRRELWERRRLVKTYGPRGTVHLFPADELPLWTAALRANQPPEGGDAAERAGLTPQRLDRLVAAIGEALDGRCLTRQQLGEELARRLGPWVLEEAFPAFGGAWPRWWLAIGEAAGRGVLCFGPNQGNRVTFVRPDQWLAGWRPVDARQALAEVFRRFLAAYGPAGPGDFAPWFRMQPAAAAELARSLGDRVEEVDVEGYRGLLPAGEDVSGGLPAGGSVLLLPSFDCYVRGAYPRDRAIPPASAARALEGAPSRSTSGRADLAGPLPGLVVDGVVVGIWERRRSGRRFDLRVEPFVRLSAAQRKAVDARATRIGEILEAPVTLSFGPIERRPHL
jgi:Winged helix DNA-binding domain